METTANWETGWRADMAAWTAAALANEETTAATRFASAALVAEEEAAEWAAWSRVTLH